MQPCFSPIWDTALVIEALSDAGTPADDPVLLKAARWLLDKEVKKVGDWKKACPAAEPGGWYFEYANEWYPDTDDTAEVLTALSRVKFPGESEDLARQGAVARGQAWLLAMQNRDGGWGAFDKDCDNEVLTYIPFADHNAMIDPSCEDITGRALEALPRDRGARRSTRRSAAPRRSSTSKQLATAPGTGAGAATTSTARSSRCAGSSTPARTCAQPRFQRTADWIRSRQNADGGWGELPHSYDDPTTKGQGPSTPSQTAWALVALFATGDRDSEPCGAAIEYLLSHQLYDGSWKDDHWTATGLPEGVLPALPPLCHLLPAPGAGALRARGNGVAGPIAPRPRTAKARCLSGAAITE